MPDTPEVTEAKARLRQLVVPAVEHLEELLHSEHDGIRLGASKEILDRGGVPAKREIDVGVDITMDEEIEELLRGVKRQVEQRNKPDTSAEYEDAVVIEDEVGELSPGEAAGLRIGVLADDVPVEAEVVSAVDAWWQASPTTVDE